MKFDKLAEAYLKVLTEKYNKGYSLYWKDEEHKRTRKWYTASTLEELLQQVNHDNLTGDFEYGMVYEDREFKSVQELLDFCRHSDFLITDPAGNVISGIHMKDEEVGPEEAAEFRYPSRYDDPDREEENHKYDRGEWLSDQRYNVHSRRVPKEGDIFVSKNGRKFIRYKKADGTLSARPYVK